jgi:lysine 6-dehydrogenase
MVVLGAGLQGSACAYDLLQDTAVERVVLADVREGALPPFLEPYRHDARLERAVVDARDAAAVRSVLEGATACMNALPYYFNFEITRIALESRVHCSDLGGNTDIVFRQLELDAAAREAGVSITPDCGLAPGLVNVLAQAGIAAVEAPDRVVMLVGGLPQHPTPPIDYHIVYSLEGVLDYYTTPGWVLREGKRTTVEALSEVQRVDFPEPVGTLEAFHTAGGLSTMAWTFEGRIRTMEYKTLRYPGHANVMRAIRGLGLLDTDPVPIGDGTVIPRQVFIACAEPRLRRPDARDLVALRVEVDGRRNGSPARVVYELIDLFDETTGISAMERTTGFSLAITGLMQAAGTVKPGVDTPDRAVPPAPYLAELARRGVDVRRIENVNAGAGP